MNQAITNIKPYIRYADARPHAKCGYVDALKEKNLKVVLPEELAAEIETQVRANVDQLYGKAARTMAAKSMMHPIVVEVTESGEALRPDIDILVED